MRTTRTPLCRWMTWLAPCVAAMAISSCSREDSPSTSSATSATERTLQRRAIKSPRPALPGELSEQERKYGVSPTVNSEVTYQPEVLVVENGSEAIRGVSDDGLVWRIDAASVPVREIQPGRILFLTTRAVGRVLAVRREGGQLAVILGPADITEIIRDCDIEMAEQPADFGSAYVYTLADMPGEAVPVDPIAWQPHDGAWFARWTDDASSMGREGWSTLLWSGDSAALSLRPVKSGRIEPFTTKPVAGLGTLGVKLSSNSGGTRMAGEVSLHLLNPRLHFHLVISKGELMVAELEMKGAAGLTMAFTAVSEDGRDSSINQRVQVPVDISLPILGPLPFTITVRQQFIVQTKFGAPGVLAATGNYTLQGSISVGYSKPNWHVGAPSDFSGRETLLNSVQGVSLAVGALSLTHQIKVIGGFGAFGFAVGPYVFLSNNINVTRHGDTDTLARCIFTGFNMDAGTGVGYVIPQPITDAINFILRTLNLREISGEGGLPGPRETIIRTADVTPKSIACTGSGEKTGV